MKCYQTVIMTKFEIQQTVDSIKVCTVIRIVLIFGIDFVRQDTLNCECSHSTRFSQALNPIGYGFGVGILPNKFLEFSSSINPVIRNYSRAGNCNKLSHYLKWTQKFNGSQQPHLKRRCYFQYPCPSGQNCFKPLLKCKKCYKL